MAKIEKQLLERNLIDKPLYDPSNASMVYYVNCALKANKLFRRDVDYMVRDGQVIIIDEFTGRIMQGRRYSEGLHQALEAKEGVKVQAESQTIASISYQNLFRMYPKLSGMTGTAMTEEAEFEEIYKLKVVSIPPNKPVIRKDLEDSIYMTLEEKDKAVINLIKECVARRQPVLVGTTNLDRSEYISSLLTKEGIRHNVLNAKQHEREAYIISEAGAPGTVTIATNMAGRGTDIKLGGSVETRIMFECADMEDSPERDKKIEQIKSEVAIAHDEVVKAGGLFVIGTERNEARRIDNQLRGRSGRQGDPGASKYFLSLEDDLIKRFAAPNFAKNLKRLGVKKDEDLTHRWISKAIKKAQERIEAMNFDIRKQLLKYDDVMNEQRKEIYHERLELMKSTDVSSVVESMVTNTAIDICEKYTSQETVPYEWKLNELKADLKSIYDIDIDTQAIGNDSTMTVDLFKQQLVTQVEQKYAEIISKMPAEFLRPIEKELTLRTLDSAWKKHLVVIEHLRRSINLQAYAQKNPLNEYKVEAFRVFEDMMNGVRRTITTAMMHLKMPDTENSLEDSDTDDNSLETISFSNIIENNSVASEAIKPSRNSPCTCGSGLRYKECHGRIDTLSIALSNLNDTPAQDSTDLQQDIQEQIDNTESIMQPDSTGSKARTPQGILEHFSEAQRNALLGTETRSDDVNTTKKNEHISTKNSEHRKQVVNKSTVRKKQTKNLQGQQRSSKKQTAKDLALDNPNNEIYVNKQKTKSKTKNSTATLGSKTKAGATKRAQKRTSVKKSSKES